MPDHQQISVRMTTAEYKQISKLAEKAHRSRGNFIYMIVQKYLDDMKRPDPLAQALNEGTGTYKP